jgi:plasmid stabilization system protein ParE
VEVIFSLAATDSLINIVSIIEEQWNIATADRFLKKVYKVIDCISLQPNMYQCTQIENVRKAVITKQTSVLYKVCPDHIEILFFWDNRQDPIL